MVQRKKNVISLEYELFVNGKLVEKTHKLNPFSFITGTGHVLSKFEENIIQSSVNGQFDFHLSVDEAYGPIRSEAIVDIPVGVFEIEGQSPDDFLVKGNSIPMQDSNGNHLNGVVVDVGKDVVRMDFNHPLAGNNLHFKGMVLSIREATDEEILHGHVHEYHDCDDCSDPDCHSRTSN